MIKVENRASALLFNFLVSNKFKRPFLLPANVCPIVPFTFLKAGVDFEFVDIDDSHAIDKIKVIQLLKLNKYDGVLFVHSYGKLYEMQSFFKIIKELDSNNCIIDDRCLCEPDFNLVNTGLSDIILFSTGYSKYVDLAFGGFGYVNERYKYESIQLKFNQSDFDNIMSQIRSCINLDSHFNYFDTDWLDTSPFHLSLPQYFKEVKETSERMHLHKKKINDIYSLNLSLEIQYPSDFHNWRFNIMVNDREKILNAIFNAGLFAGTNYPSVSSIFKSQISEKADHQGKKIINLFNDFRFDQDKAEKVCDIINRELDSNG